MTQENGPQHEEQELIRLVCAGDREHFYTLIRPYARAVYSTAYGVVGNQADAEDVSQEALLKALRALGSFRGESKFSTWLIQIAFNEARLSLRSKRTKLYESLDSGRDDDEEYRPRDFADWREIPSEALARKELREGIQRAVANLKDIYREVIILRDMRQLSVRETADLLGVSTDVVKTRLLRARLQVRDALAPGYDGTWTAGSGKYRKVRLW